MVNSRRGGELFAIAAAVLWGMNYQVVKSNPALIPQIILK